jgi:uncharacterized protein YbjT (DUF2867 family)
LIKLHNLSFSHPQIVGIVRDETSDKSTALKGRGVELRVAQLTDTAALEKAFAGIDGLFAFTTPYGAGNSADEELVQGHAFIVAAKNAGVKHVVFSSVGGAERNSNVPHFDSKRKVELELIESGLPNTILRPVAFMV